MKDLFSRIKYHLFPTMSEEGRRYDLKRTIEYIQTFVAFIVITRILVTAALIYFTNIFAAFAFFVSFTIISIFEKRSIKLITFKLEQEEFDTKPIETMLSIYSSIRIFIACIIYHLFVQSHLLHYTSATEASFAAQAASFYIAGQLTIIIYQTASSPKIMFPILSTASITTLAMAFYTAIMDNSILPVFVPFAFVLGMTTLAIAISSDRVRSTEMFLANKKTTDEYYEQQKIRARDSKIHEGVELAASAGTYQIYFNDTPNSWSNGAARIFGYKDNSITPSYHDIKNLVIPEYLPPFIKAYYDCSTQGNPYDLLIKIQTKDNITKQVLLNGIPIYGENDDIIGIDGIVMDQTRHLHALEEAIRAEDLLNIALIQGRAAVIEHDFRTGDIRGYGALDIFGINGVSFNTGKRGKDVTKDLMRAINTTNINIIFGAMEDAINTGEAQSREHQVKLPDRDDAYIRVVVSADGDLNARQGRMIAIVTDIAEEVRNRNVLSDAVAEAGRATRTKSEFLANMSHEIRTPLNGVIAVTGLLAKTNLDDKQKEMVELIESSGDILTTLLNDILDLARVESGRLEIEQIDFNLKQAISSSASLFSVKAEEKGLKFVTEITQAADNVYEGDPNRIKQVINNLLSNAIKFTNSGTIYLRAYEYDCEINPVSNKNCEECEWIFEIQDSGKGISQTDIDNLFNRFEQLDGSITREHGGSGLGLAITKSLVSLMGGKIEVRSELGEGATFRISLPLCLTENVDKDANSNNPESNLIEQNHDLKILAADDNFTNRKVIEMILESIEGVKLTLCTNGDEAVNAYKSDSYDIVLMDLQMPVKDGLTAIREMRIYEAVNNFSGSPIVAVSANAMSHHVREAIDAGANLHLAKPFTPNELLSTIEEALEISDEIVQRKSS